MRTRSIVLRLALAALLAACAKRETPVEAGLRTQTFIVGNYAEPVSRTPLLALGAKTAQSSPAFPPPHAMSSTPEVL